MGTIGIEKAAAFGSQIRDKLIRGCRSLSDGLTSTLQSVGFRIARQVDRYALADQNQAARQSQRQEDPKQASGQIHPEVAQGSGSFPYEASDEGNPHGEAGSAGEEILRDQSQQLGEIPESGFAAIGLPGGSG